MKKLLLIAVLALASVSVALSQDTIVIDSHTIPQPEEPTTKFKFQGYINKGMQLTIDEDGFITPYFLNAEVSFGVKIYEYAYIGLGTGYAWSVWDSFRFPFYIDMRGYLPNKSKVKPYFTLSPGTGLLVLMPAFYIHTGFGFDYKRFNMELGYKLWEMVDYDDDFYIENQVYLRLGVRIGK